MELEDRFHSLVEQAGEAFYLVDFDGRLLDVNRHACQALGYAREELLALSLPDIDPRHSEEDFSRFARTLEAESPVTLEATHLRKDGTTFPVEIRAGLLEIQGNLHVLLLARDISTRKRLEKELEDYRENLEKLVRERTAELSVANDTLQQEMAKRARAQEEMERLATVVEQASDVVIITDPEGRMEYVNEAFETITGYPRDEAIGQNTRILKSGKHDDGFYHSMWHTLKCGDAWRGRIINRKKDGSLFQVEAAMSPLQNSHGEIVNFVSVMRDITHMVELETQLRQAQKMEAIGALASGIAHDFNNVLTAILGQAHLALTCRHEDSQVHRSLSEIIRAGARAANLVKQILTFSRQTEQEVKPVQLAAIVKETLALLRGSLPATIEIRYQIDEGCPPVLADATQLHQVLMNICTNAYHAMEQSGGVLTVALGLEEISPEHAGAYLDLQAGRYTLLTISDTGHGMDDETKRRVFEPYFTTKPEGKGTGMGLAMVHGIVKNHNGTVHVYSEAGKGTEFKIYLPVIEEVEDTTAASVEKIKYGNGERVLFVDDEKTILDSGSQALTTIGYELTSLSCPAEALETFRANPWQFDVVITDRTMPKMTGPALAVELLSIRPDLPIILLTGLNNAVTSEEVKNTGIVKTISKPVSLARLSNAIHDALSASGENRS